MVSFGKMFIVSNHWQPLFNPTFPMIFDTFVRYFAALPMNGQKVVTSRKMMGQGVTQPFRQGTFWLSRQTGNLLTSLFDVYNLQPFLYRALLLSSEKSSNNQPGVSILMSYGVNPHYVKLPIFSEFMENSTKFMKNSGLTKWTQNLRQEDQNRFQEPGIYCLKIEATHQINVFISVFCCIGDHIWQKHCFSFINT